MHIKYITMTMREGAELQYLWECDQLLPGLYSCRIG